MQADDPLPTGLEPIPRKPVTPGTVRVWRSVMTLGLKGGIAGRYSAWWTKASRQQGYEELEARGAAASRGKDDGLSRAQTTRQITLYLKREEVQLKLRLSSSV